MYGPYGSPYSGGVTVGGCTSSTLDSIEKSLAQFNSSPSANITQSRTPPPLLPQLHTSLHPHGHHETHKNLDKGLEHANFPHEEEEAKSAPVNDHRIGLQEAADSAALLERLFCDSLDDEEDHCGPCRLREELVLVQEDRSRLSDELNELLQER